MNQVAIVFGLIIASVVAVGAFQVMAPLVTNAENRSMEAEARLILREALERKQSYRNLAEITRDYFGPDNGVDLELPPRGPGREPPSFH